MVNWSVHLTLPFNCNNTTQDKNGVYARRRVSAVLVMGKVCRGADVQARINNG